MIEFLSGQFTILMSRQAFIQQAPQLFLSQRQYEQLERSFTDPIRRRVTELEGQISELEDQVEFWQAASAEHEAAEEALQEQVTTLQTELATTSSQLQTAQRTITQQTQQITALNTRISELEAIPTFPHRYIEITNNRQFTADSAIVCFSFQAGYGGSGTIATYIPIATGTYEYLNVPANAESATILYNSRNQALSFYIDSRWVQDVEGIQGFFVNYNSNFNDRIMALY